MTSAEQEPGHGLSDAQHHPAQRRHADQDRTLLAMQQLEAALGAAAPRREQAWLAEVRRTLGVLSEAARDEADNAAQPDSLLSDIARTQPWLRNRVRGLRIHYGQLRDAIAALRQELDSEAGQKADFTDIRQRLTWVLAGLRHQRAAGQEIPACRAASAGVIPRSVTSYAACSRSRAVIRHRGGKAGTHSVNVLRGHSRLPHLRRHLTQRKSTVSPARRTSRGRASTLSCTGQRPRRKPGTPPRPGNPWPPTPPARRPARPAHR